jgi:hypothetical protein
MPTIEQLTIALQADPADLEAGVTAVDDVLNGIENCNDEGWRQIGEAEWLEAKKFLAEWEKLIAALVDYADRLGVDLVSLRRLTGEEWVLLRGLKPLYPDARGMPYACLMQQDAREWRRIAAICVRDLVEFKLGLRSLVRRLASGAAVEASSGPPNDAPAPSVDKVPEPKQFEPKREPVDDAKAKVYLNTWLDILKTLDLGPRNNADKAFVLRMNEQRDGPIQIGGRGERPMVDKAKLIEWWDKLDLQQADLEQRRDSRKRTVENSHPYGREGEVVPDIAGGVKKRRSRANLDQPTET